MQYVWSGGGQEPRVLLAAGLRARPRPRALAAARRALASPPFLARGPRVLRERHVGQGSPRIEYDGERRRWGGRKGGRGEGRGVGATAPSCPSSPKPTSPPVHAAPPPFFPFLLLLRALLRRFASPNLTLSLVRLQAIRVYQTYVNMMNDRIRSRQLEEPFKFRHIQVPPHSPLSQHPATASNRTHNLANLLFAYLARGGVDVASCALCFFFSEMYILSYSLALRPCSCLLPLCSCWRRFVVLVLVGCWLLLISKGVADERALAARVA